MFRIQNKTNHKNNFIIEFKKNNTTTKRVIANASDQASAIYKAVKLAKITGFKDFSRVCVRYRIDNIKKTIKTNRF